MTSLEFVRAAAEDAGDIEDDLKGIIIAAVDLARYRRIATAADLSRAVAFELVNRAEKLPDHNRQES